MIDPHWQVVDLDPVTWRNLGPFLEPQQYIAAAQPGEHGLFVLHDYGRVLKVVDTQSSRRVAIPAEIDDPEALARELYERGDWQRVHIIDRQHLIWVAQQAQMNPRRDLSLDAYYHLVYALMWGKPNGYVSLPPPPDRWHGWTYTDLRRFLAALPTPSTLALGVYRQTELMIGLILVCGEGQIHQVTTFEGLNWSIEHPGPTEQTLQALRDALSAQFAPAAAILLCTESSFAGWLESGDKAAFLAQARTNVAALWYVR